MPVNVGKGGSTVDTKPVVQTQNNPIRVNNGVKLNNNPVNKVQVQNNQQNNRPQFNDEPHGQQRRQQLPPVDEPGAEHGNGGNNRRGFMH